MSRVTRSFCPRSSMPQPPVLQPPEWESLDAATSTPKQPDSEVMTWQQQEDLAKLAEQTPCKNRSRWPQSKPLRHKAIGGTHTIATDAGNCKLAPQTDPSPYPRRHRRKSQAPTAASVSYHGAKTATPANNSTPTSTTAKQAPISLGPSKNKSPYNKKRRPKETNMTSLRREAYVPPHLRNRTSANSAKAHLGNGSAAANVSPASSEKSKATGASKPDSTPNRVNSHQATPVSPPTTLQEPVEQEKHDVALPADFNVRWDEPKPKPAPATKKPGNPRWPRNNQPHKKTVWPKAKDMRCASSSDGSDGGIECRSNSNGDPDYDVKKLLDWNGDWLPAPESWSARKGHADRHFGQHIEQWMNGHAPECCKPVYYLPNTFIDNGGVCKELAPRYWLEAKVEGTTLRESWKTISASQPEPLDDIDLTGYQPWWELYEDVVYSELVQKNGQGQQQLGHASCYLNALPVPDAMVDLTDPENPIESWKLASVVDKIQEKKKRMEEKQRRTLARRTRPVPESKFPMPVMEDRRIRPKANIYLRPVQPADIHAIGEIYNYYVENSIYTHEFDVRTDAQIRQRVNDITSAGHPYLVAISKSNRSRVTPGYVHEKVVGYINLDDYCGQASLFRYTFQMELFVHPGFVCKGIGKCLMDRLLEIVDTSYRVRGGYEYINNYEYLKTGPSRVVKTILLNVHHEHGEDAEREWQGRFLTECKFTRVGRLPKVGYKLGKEVDVAIYAHHTKEDINATARPTVAG
ncbi:hypothetical protein ACJBU6_04926 [Exserohilum turcicum]